MVHFSEMTVPVAPCRYTVASTSTEFLENHIYQTCTNIRHGSHIAIAL